MPNNELTGKLIGIARHRMAVDGEGVTTLVAFHGCPLRCKYCLNPQSITNDTMCMEHTVEELIDEVRIENLKWIASEHTELLPSITLRLPHIPNPNTEEDINNSQAYLETLGYHKFDKFEYIIR